jgi:hypothetical protein
MVSEPIFGSFILKYKEVSNQKEFFESQYILNIDSNSISFKKSINSCQTELFQPLYSNQNVEGFYCTEECCDDNESQALDFSGKYILYSSGELEILNDQCIYHLIRSAKQ